jgi:Polyketide cyclase / dehydrase and lipid transport
MALPLAIPLALLGGSVGRSAATSDSHSTSHAMFMLLALPLAAATEPASGRALHEVRSSRIIDAPPEAVWPHVVSFRELPEPTDWLFRLGIAYPIRARIEGSGVGAVRYCVFSTGSFVEPITRWEPGRRLSFDVVDSPAILNELSLYPGVSPPHLHGYLRSKRGEFRLVDLGDGRTRLEGSTWYELEMGPEGYWQIFSDALIHRIHQRVLEHIEREVEGELRP